MAQHRIRRIGGETARVLRHRRDIEIDAPSRRSHPADGQPVAHAQTEVFRHGARNDDVIDIGVHEGEVALCDFHSAQSRDVPAAEPAQTDVLVLAARPLRLRVDGHRGDHFLHAFDIVKRLDEGYPVAAALCIYHKVAVAEIGGFNIKNVIINRVFERKHAEKHCHRDRDRNDGCQRAQRLRFYVFQREPKRHFTTTPSEISTLRDAYAACAAECVTITSATPFSRLMRPSSSIT